MSNDNKEIGSPEWYEAWRHEAFHLLMTKQDIIRETCGLGKWPRYDHDIETQQLTFSEDGIVKVIADIQVVGSVGPSNWLWGWANEHWPEAAVVDMEKVQSFGQENGIQEITSAYVEDDDLNVLGWELTAIAVRVLDAVGAYRSPSETGALFLLIKSIRLVS